MPRQRRVDEAGAIRRALNPGHRRQTLSHQDDDYEAFLRVLGAGRERYPFDLCYHVLMPNHWHLVLRPAEDEGMGRLLRWFTATHSQRHHAHHPTAAEGHGYPACLNSFP